MVPPMPLSLNTILRNEGLAPESVRLLRHQDGRSLRGRSPYDLWRDDPPAFDVYQTTQSIGRRRILSGPYWAVFLATAEGETLFAGLWSARYIGLNEVTRIWPHAVGEDPPGTVDTYELVLQEIMADLAGRLVIGWTGGERNWVQYAHRREKPVLEIRRVFREPDFPGYLRFKADLSRIASVPPAWRAALGAARGIYLLTCPRTREQYVGSATGAGGFLARWMDYVANGHGGNVGLRSRDPADYQVSILEVVGNAATFEDVIALEGLWKSKLQSREMGLNQN